VLAELLAASQRPVARYPLDYSAPWNGATPGDLGAVLLRLNLRACARLALGQSDRALDDVRLQLYLVDSQKDEPRLWPQWDRVYRFRRAMQPIWEGLARHAWTAAQCQELAARLARYDFLASAKLAFDAQRAETLWTIDHIPTGGSWDQAFGSFRDQPPLGCEYLGETLVGTIHRLQPRGWFAREKRNYSELFDRYLRAGFDPVRKRVAPAQLNAAFAEADQLDRASQPQGRYPGVYLRATWNHQWAVATMLDPGVFRAVRGFCIAQASADLASLACALESHRLDHGEFPETLAALVPRFLTALPKDAITGEPYRYRRSDDGAFVLYSVGWNETDEGGNLALKKDGVVNFELGDWIWGGLW
jgi:hypothetical protein